MTESEIAIIGIGVATAAAATASATVRMRANFSVQHLMAAARLAREVAITEAANQGRPFGPFYEIIFGSSVGCVVLASAAAEAYINELFADRLEFFPGHAHTLLDALWGEFEQKTVVAKFDLAHRLRMGRGIDKGAPPAQALDRLFKLRNALVHFKPEWDDEVANHERLSKQLEGYAGRSPWRLHEPLFPQAWATTVTTSWAVSAVLAFVSIFSAVTGLPDRLQQFGDRFNTIAAG